MTHFYLGLNLFVDGAKRDRLVWAGDLSIFGGTLVGVKSRLTSKNKADNRARAVLFYSRC